MTGKRRKTGKEVGQEMVQQALPLDDAPESPLIQAGRASSSVPVGDLAADAFRHARMSLQDLRELHRMLSEQILDVQRAMAKLLSTGSPADEDSGQISRLRDQGQQLRAERFRLDEQIEAGKRKLAELLPSAGQTSEKETLNRGLTRVRHPNRDFFLADLFDYALKDDGASMEAPIFTLSTKPDLSIWEWRSKDGGKHVKVTPSVLGRATQHDKDVLIYVISQLVEGLNQEREDAQSRTVRFTVYDFMVSTNRATGGSDYKRLHETFERLRGTTITTDIKTAGERVREGFGIIDAWRIVEKSKLDERMIAVEVTLSRWLYNAVQAFEVLTIHPDYFRLRKPLARRLYEIARKHCGHQAFWRISLPLLQTKTGSRSTLREFRRAVRAIEQDESLPQYQIVLEEDDVVSFWSIKGSKPTCE